MKLFVPRHLDLSSSNPQKRVSREAGRQGQIINDEKQRNTFNLS